MGTQEQIAVHICGFYGVQRWNYFGGESIRRNEELENLEMERLQLKMISLER